MNDQLKELGFLVGKWKGTSKDQFGAKGTIETSYTYALEPSERFISCQYENRQEGKMVNRGAVFLMFDSNLGKFVWKDVISYGWISNGVGEWKNDRLTVDIVSIDGEPDYFKGLRLRNFIQKSSDYEIVDGVETAKPGEEFRVLGRISARKVRGLSVAK